MKYIEKILMAIDYIEANLTEKIDLDMVAEAVHYSKYHLHRIFSKTLGMRLALLCADRFSSRHR